MKMRHGQPWHITSQQMLAAVHSSRTFSETVFKVETRVGTRGSSSPRLAHQLRDCRASCGHRFDVWMKTEGYLKTSSQFLHNF